MRSRIFLLTLFLLSACGIVPKPELRIQKVYCLTPEQYLRLVQAEPEKIGEHLSADPAEKDRQKTEQNVLVRRYADGLLTVLGGCTGSAP